MDQLLKTTCLHEDHIALGAKMSPFAGFDMPIQYQGITQEHNAVRNAVGMFDVSHMGEIFVEGPGADDFVNHVFTNDVSTLEPGHILYGFLCKEDGGTVDDLLVYREYDGGWLLVVNAANIEKDYAWLLKCAEGVEGVTLYNDSDSWGQIALQGPGAEDALVRVFSIEELRELEFYSFDDLEDEDGGRVIISRTGYTGEDGFEIYASPEVICDLWAAFLDDGVQPCGLGCRDTLRFEAGLPLYGDELSEEITPVMAGFSMFCKFDKDFIGRDALLAQKTAGPARRVVGIEIQDAAIPRAGYPVELEDGTQVGVVTTGYHSITLDKSICFALVDAAHAALGTPLWIRIRKKVFPGAVVKKRFYQTKYKK